MASELPPAVEAGVFDRIAHVARAMRTTLAALAGEMQTEFAEFIPELRGDPSILQLLFASTESNIETMLHFAQGSIDLDDIEAPTAAIAYARRLAQRGTSSNALVRAYRLGQRRFLDVAFDEISRSEPDGEIAFASAQRMHAIANAYIDRVAEQVVREYESERERWLTNRNTVRAAILNSLIKGDEIDITAGESALGYRLRQNHLGIVVWDRKGDDSPNALQKLQTLVAAIGEAVGGSGQPLFIPRDRSHAWAWIPLGWEASDIDDEVVRRIHDAAGDALHVAMGSPGKAIAGFRDSHVESLRAYSVATVADEEARRVTNYSEPGVQAAALLAADLNATRSLVATALGGLAEESETVERLRETLLDFLNEDGRYQNTAERIHVHRNTVRYRVAKALEIRGRPLDDDRFNLQLALVACRWLGRTVLPN
jgi:DNA-binding PucR family transcriptional regulator